MRRYRPPRSPMLPRQKAKLICFFLSVLLITLTLVGTSHLRALLGNLAVTRVTNLVGQLVTAAVSDAVEGGEIQYNSLISLEKDETGHVTALQSNMAEFNRLQSAITQAGINQTTHRVMLYVDVSMSILLPGFRTGTQVSSSFSVAETVIVGDVPDTYTYFDSGRDIEEEAHEYAINNG